MGKSINKVVKVETKPKPSVIEKSKYKIKFSGVELRRSKRLKEQKLKITKTVKQKTEWQWTS